MSVPNLRQIPVSLFIPKLKGGPKISKFGHVTQATPTLGSFYDPDAVGSILYVSAKFEADSSLFVQKLIGGSQNFEIGSRDPKPRPF